MTVPRTPRWLLEKGVANVSLGNGFFPDFNNPTFLDHHEKLIKAFGGRYAGSADIDHVDIGSVGCWGEWNTACCQGAQARCQRHYPTEANQIAITDWYFKPRTFALAGDLRAMIAARRAGNLPAVLREHMPQFASGLDHVRELYQWRDALRTRLP